MVRVGKFLLNPAHITGFQVDSASVYIYMSAAFQNGTSHIITHRCDSPDEAAAIGEDIEAQVDGESALAR